MVEFAIVLPLLITVLFGLGEVALSIFAATQATNAIQALADLGTQSVALRSTDVNNIYNAAYLMMNPLPSSSLLLRITNVVSNGNGGAFVSWSCGQGNLGPLTALSVYGNTTAGTASSTLLVLTTGKTATSNGFTYSGANTSFVIVEGNYTYTPVTKMILTTSQVTTSEAIAMPRLATYIGFPWNGVSGQWPGVPTSYKKTSSLTFTANSNTITCNYGS